VTNARLLAAHRLRSRLCTLPRLRVVRTPVFIERHVLVQGAELSDDPLAGVNAAGRRLLDRTSQVRADDLDDEDLLDQGIER
jgi:hypothetical protein